MDAVQLDLFAELEPKKAWLFEGMFKRLEEARAK